MIIYQTDSFGFFVGAIDADESPLEPGIYLIPAGCVETAPPVAGDHQIPHWDGSAWGLAPDFRGVQAWDKTTGQAVIVQVAGKTLDELGLSAEPVPDPGIPIAAGSARQARQEAAKQRRAAKLARRGDDLAALKLLNNL